MSRPKQISEIYTARMLENYATRNDSNLVRALNNIGLWHVSPCTDASFKNTLADRERTVRFITSFCELLDRLPDSSCRMLDERMILNNSEVQDIEVIPESIGYTGSVAIKRGKKDKEDGKGSELPEHPKIDSGFIVNLSDGTIFKMGIEMQVEDKGNMPAREVDYGMRIFRYKGIDQNMGSVCKVFELSLSRWSITNAPQKFLSISYKDGADCDKDVVEKIACLPCLSCVSIFLGKSIDIMGRILGFLKKKYPKGADDLNVDDQTNICKLVSGAMIQERCTLSQQVMALTRPGIDVSLLDYADLCDDEMRLVDRLGFFKYGHLMSDEDVQALKEENLKNDYQCIKIQEENIMNNSDQISAIWGSVAPYDRNTAGNVYKMTLLQQAEIQAKDEEIQAKDEEIQSINMTNACLRKQLNDLIAQQARMPQTKVEGRTALGEQSKPKKPNKD
jgi:hypothetical protein